MRLNQKKLKNPIASFVWVTAWIIFAAVFYFECCWDTATTIIKTSALLSVSFLSVMTTLQPTFILKIQYERLNVYRFTTVNSITAVS